MAIFGWKLDLLTLGTSEKLSPLALNSATKVKTSEKSRGLMPDWIDSNFHAIFLAVFLR